MNLLKRLERLQQQAAINRLPSMSDAELEELVGHDEIGQKLKSCSDFELQRIARSGKWN
ncbi:hypothetical protein XM38_012200 [Halomicronema hongdechloris C2206]|uniref:Uncharacterized protein n=1 Tax=Halomicronema hongdechloris C2206 TaxID=1641165 RepID=A0A1Z3HJ19_9CYAN|nr:hypothetical protein XM38_012200 [Halomicronema hongdechloris C2206]